MKTNTFGEQQAEPDDDITAMFEEVHGYNTNLEAMREEFEYADHLGGWTVEVRNGQGDGIIARGFESEAALAAYLEKHQVAVS